jgi:hypothetical protein
MTSTGEEGRNKVKKSTIEMKVANSAPTSGGRYDDHYVVFASSRNSMSAPGRSISPSIIATETTCDNFYFERIFAN